jgi:hypothetical protein
VALKLIYLMFAKLLGWMVLRIRSDITKDIEILVPRHQLAVLAAAHPSAADVLGAPSDDRRVRAPAARPSPTRADRYAVRHPALAPATPQPAALPRHTPTAVDNIQRHDQLGGLIHEISAHRIACAEFPASTGWMNSYVHVNQDPHEQDGVERRQDTAGETATRSKMSAGRSMSCLPQSGPCF